MALLSALFKKAKPASVRIEPNGHVFEVGRGETILECALKLGIAYPHDCTVGTCGSCKSKLISGKVEAITPFGYTLSREELQAGYILACQAIPKSDLVLEVQIQSSEEIVSRTLQGRLVSADELTHDIRRLTWQTDEPMHYKAGQYANIRWGDASLSRSYSFAAAPESDGRKSLCFFIRHIPGGAFTDMVFNGDPFSCDYLIDGPHGNFWLRDGEGPILCVAGGSGLAPIISLLQQAAKRRVRRDCILLFGARASRDLYAQQDIAAIRNQWTAGFDFWPVLSEEAIDGTRTGLVTSHIPAALKRLGPDCQAYLCGPPAMIDSAIEGLSSEGVSLDAIFYDKFTDASTSKGRD